jgi:hypothetical protein
VIRPQGGGGQAIRPDEFGNLRQKLPDAAPDVSGVSLIVDARRYRG